jgi:hypothetical protein
MRTFKFRAWIPKLKYFCKHVLFEDGAAVALHNDGGFGYPISADQCVIQQFTGLQDSKGLDIYEGDLLEFAYTDDRKFIGKVEYSEKFASFVVVSENAFETFLDLADHTESFKVVGNLQERYDQRSTN